MMGMRMPVRLVRIFRGLLVVLCARVDFRIVVSAAAVVVFLVHHPPEFRAILFQTLPAALSMVFLPLIFVAIPVTSWRWYMRVRNVGQTAFGPDWQRCIFSRFEARKVGNQGSDLRAFLEHLEVSVGLTGRGCSRFRGDVDVSDVLL